MVICKMVNIEVIDTGSPKVGPYNLGIKAGNLVFISGQVGDQGAKGIKEQTLTAFEKIKKILEAVEASVSNISSIMSFSLSLDTLLLVIPGTFSNRIIFASVSSAILMASRKSVCLES